MTTASPEAGPRRRSPGRAEGRADAPRPPAEPGAPDAQGALDEKFRRLGDDVAARARAAGDALAAFRAFWARDVAPLDAAFRQAGPARLAGRLAPVRAALRRLDAALAAEGAALAADRRWLERLAAPEPLDPPGPPDAAPPAG